MSASGPPPSGRAPEAERDQGESAFTPILRSVWAAEPRLLCIAFVDTEGECIDYVSSIDPFEAKVASAHALVLLDQLRTTRERVGNGEPHTMEITCDAHELWARRVCDEYVVVLLSRGGVDRARLKHVLDRACEAFRHEVGIEAPVWDQTLPSAGDPDLRVSVRPAVGWRYAPTAIVRDAERLDIAAVLGRWSDERLAPGKVCFRVRTESGQELTLMHDTADDSWAVVS